MSCTVIAVPYALAWVIGAVATAAATALENAHNKQAEEEFSNTFDFLSDKNCNEEVHTITAEHFMEKVFETPFVDKAILLKTLEEHGVTNISENDCSISGNVDKYTLSFTRNEIDKPFSLRITTKENTNAEEKLNDLNSEYALNVQEDAYLHIVDKLKENNMTIEDEVVEDDNTIVLTVNIDG